MRKLNSRMKLLKNYRSTVFMVGCNLVSVLAMFCKTNIERSNMGRSRSLTILAPNIIIAPVEPAQDFQGHPLLARSQRILYTQKSWNWGGLFHSDYRWLNDHEFIFGESYYKPEFGRFEYEHLFKYNILTHHKLRLKQLEQWIDMFYRLYVEPSPDGKWLLWRSIDGGTNIAAIDGSHYQQWATLEGFHGTVVWMHDSRHWFEIGETKEDTKMADIHEYDRLNPSVDFAHEYSVMMIPSENCDIRLGPDPNTMVSLNYSEKGNTLTVTNSLLSNLNTHTGSKQISLPSSLLKPNIVEAQLSPDCTKFLVIVGHGKDGPTCDPDAYPLAEATLHRDYSIFSANVDGTGMHEVGTWSEPVHPNILTDLEDVRWLPGGKLISYFYGDTMYTVAAD